MQEVKKCYKAVLTALVVLFSGCASVGGTVNELTGPHQRFEKINDWMTQTQLFTLHAGAIELESDEQDLDSQKKLGKILFHTASITRERAKSEKAKKLLSGVLEKDSSKADALVYLGATNTIIARDLENILYWVTPLGLIRLKLVKKGISQMDEAVAMDEMNPEIRLIRGVSMVNMPQVFGQNSKGESDLQTLVEWAKNPEGHKYSFMLTEFGATAAYILASASLRGGKQGEARERFALAASLAPDSAVGAAAGEMNQVLLLTVKEEL